MYFRIKKLPKGKIKKQQIVQTIQELYNFAMNYKGKNREVILIEIGKRIWKLKLNYRVELPREIKRFLCRKCNSLLIPGINLRVRNFKGFMEYKCMNCNKVRRYKLKK